jgi:hypothetical protein
MNLDRTVAMFEYISGTILMQTSRPADTMKPTIDASRDLLTSRLSSAALVLGKLHYVIGYKTGLIRLRQVGFHQMQSPTVDAKNQDDST